MSQKIMIWQRIQNSCYEETQWAKKISQLQFNYLRNKIHEQKEYFNEETETLKKKNQTIFRAEELNKWDEDCIRSTGNRTDHLKEKISVLRDRNLKIIHVKDGRELRYFLKMKMLH